MKHKDEIQPAVFLGSLALILLAVLIGSCLLGRTDLAQIMATLLAVIITSVAAQWIIGARHEK